MINHPDVVFLFLVPTAFTPQHVEVAASHWFLSNVLNAQVEKEKVLPPSTFIPQQRARQESHRILFKPLQLMFFQRFKRVILKVQYVWLCVTR